MSTENLIYSQASLDHLRFLSDSTLTDTCTIIARGDVNNPRGGVSRGIIGTYSEIPCRLDDDVRNTVPQQSRSNIVNNRGQRFIYISIETVKNINYVPKTEDTIETTAGNPLGEVSKYKVLDANTETDESDIVLLVERE